MAIKDEVTQAAACLQGKTDKVEPWYGTEYSQDGVVSDWLSNWLKAFPNGCIHLPELNPFISSEFSLIDVSLLPKNVLCTASILSLVQLQ